MNNQKFLIPKEIRATQKLFNLLSLRMLTLALMYMMFVLYSDSFIPASYRLTAWIVVGVACVFWMIPSVSNPKKNMLEALIIVLKRDRHIYESIPYATQNNMEILWEDWKTEVDAHVH
ncbi:DUF5592 family protein [Listeria seeligeri]|uniref:DUF5592 family protein n=1 Tax=Listeria seeligeri TaxID=1640 RepID=UPI00162AD0B9|nr:DUF5592 family protein [Listeria seeligeri]MBC2233050.1 hypothetical protein [Listeria seeligeri]